MRDPFRLHRVRRVVVSRVPMSSGTSCLRSMELQSCDGHPMQSQLHVHLIAYPLPGIVIRLYGVSAYRPIFESLPNLMACRAACGSSDAGRGTKQVSFSSMERQQVPRAATTTNLVGLQQSDLQHADSRGGYICDKGVPDRLPLPAWNFMSVIFCPNM